MVRKKRTRWGLKAVLVASLFLVVGCGSISGTVSSCGAPLQGVTVELKGATCASTTTTTDASGNYRFQWLAKGTYTVTPLMSGYSFTPANQTVTVVKAEIKGVNFDAGSGGYSVSGTITLTSGGAPLPGVTVELLKDAAPVSSTTTDAGGNYQFTCLSGGVYTITPSIPGYGFSPANRQETLNSSVTLDFGAAPNTARAWGLATSGQLGDGQTAVVNASPVEVINLSKVVAVAAGGDHSLALLNDGTVWAWGLGASGQLGDGSSGDNIQRNTPVQVSTTWDNNRKAVAIAAGAEHSMALLDDGTVWAWGKGDSGQLGDGTGADSPVPVQAQGLTGVTAIACGGYYSLAVGSGGTVWTWGDNSAGQLGRVTADLLPLTPGQVVDINNVAITNVASIAGGDFHTITAKSDGTVWAWGGNYYGQLGVNPATTPNNMSINPVQVTGLSGIVTVAAGSNHSIVAGSDGTVWTWGSNAQGQLGIGPSTPSSFTPVVVNGLPAVATVAAGSYHSVVAGSDGSVWAWGRNNAGQLGNGSTGADEYTPVAVIDFLTQLPLTNIIKVGAGASHTIAVKSP